MPSLDRLPTVTPLRDVDEPLGPLHRASGPKVTDASFKVVKRSYDQQMRFAKRIEWVATGIGSLLGAVLVIYLAWHFGGH